MNKKTGNSLFYRLRKMLFNPFWKTRDGIKKTYDHFFTNRYNPMHYWKRRHRKFRFDLRGVGNCSLSVEENEKAYQQASQIFLNLCKEQGIGTDFDKIKMLDIGCGTGFYADLFRTYGGKEYLGFDITDLLFPQLRKKFPDFRFRKSDITKNSIHEKFDIIIMIDVTQHIVNNQLFFAAMKNIRSSLSENSVFIVTSWLSKQFKKRRPYEVERPIEFYKKEFPNAFFSEPIPFRDKYIFSISLSKKR